MPTSSARQAALALALGAMIAACTGSRGDDQPQTLPTIKLPSPSPPATPSAASTVASAAEGSARSVEVFIRSYYQEINRAIETGDVGPLTSYSIPACPCRQLVTSIKEKSTGSRIRGGRFLLRGVSPHDVTPNLAGVVVLFDVQRAEVVKPDGTVLETVEPATGARDDFSLVRSDGRWLVANGLELN